MKVKYIGEYYKVVLIKNKIYDVIGVEDGWYRVNTEVGETAIFSPKCFEIVEEDEETP